MRLSEKYIFAIGFLGQFMFSMRFFIQWIYSEKRKKSVVPKSFWYFSLFGGTLLLLYAILRKDIVFTLGQAAGIVIYLRNLYLIKKHNEN
jgi:lipid-A-disaccharide synthase-like uncharacterized protein